MTHRGADASALSTASAGGCEGRGVMGRYRDLYIAIMVAAAQGKGLKLSAEEVSWLAIDDAIATRAANGLEEGEFWNTGENGYMHTGWEHIDPYASRSNPYNGATRYSPTAARTARSCGLR